MAGEGYTGARQPSAQVPAAVGATDVRHVQHLGLIEPIQHAALAGKSDADIAASLGLSERQVKSVREHLGIAPGTRLMRPGDDEIPFARGGAVGTPPMITRKQSNYSATRGKPDHHCGPDGKWPHGFCEHYLKSNKCRLVAGFIAAHGGCDWWKVEKERAAGGRVEDTSSNARKKDFPHWFLRAVLRRGGLRCSDAA
jgi:hypothetical protein